jgi:hypothetical protein
LTVRTKAEWRNSAERGARIERDCDRTANRLRLVSSAKEGRHGRWLLNGDWTWAEVVTLANGIYVGGDIETVVFVGGPDRAAHPRGRVYWMATRSYTYAKEKAHAGDTAPNSWDIDCARGEILWHRRVDQLSREHARELWGFLDREPMRHEFVELINELTEDCELCGMGEVTARSVFMATAVLRRLAHLFDCQDFQATSNEWFRRAA